MPKIYTKTGDKGQTGLIGGKRVWKDHPRIEVYGTVDELNSCMGIVLSFLDSFKMNVKSKKTFQSRLRSIQNDLFNLGCQLANPNPKSQVSLPKISDQSIHNLEQWIDQMEKDLTPLRQFILPGGISIASFLHLARSICRRAERLCVTISRQEKLDVISIRYLNRLSDALFVAARWVQAKAKGKEILWIPEKP